MPDYMQRIPTNELRVGDKLFGLGIVESVNDMGFTYRNRAGEPQVRFHRHYEGLMVTCHSSFQRDLVEVMFS